MFLLRIGSIKVDYVIAYDDETGVSSELITASSDLIQGTQIMFDGELVNATSGKLSKIFCQNIEENKN
jgi:hypothetical protein